MNQVTLIALEEGLLKIFPFNSDKKILPKKKEEHRRNRALEKAKKVGNYGKKKR